jgi:hypothetical protein
MELVIKTFEKELLADGMKALKPLERADVAEGVANPDEVQQVVMNRSGSILSASTILKSDFFLNLQKMSLPEYVAICCIIDMTVMLFLQADRRFTKFQTSSVDSPIGNL